MTLSGLAVVLGAAILAILAVRAFWIMRRERGEGRGALPGKGHHTLRSEYFSGVGGGETSEYKVPKDPQEYARLFVPKPERNGQESQR